MFKFIILSYPNAIPKEHECLIALFEAGLTHFHIRKQTLSEAELRTYIQRIPSSFHNRLILHHHHQLAQEFAVKGIHFNRWNPYTTNTSENLLLTQASHSFDDIRNLATNIHYSFLSPIFDSISKKKYYSQFSVPDLKDFFHTYQGNSQVIALGGIDERKVQLAKEIGFHGIAVLGCIWEPLVETQNIATVIRKYHTIQREIDA